MQSNRNELTDEKKITLSNTERKEGKDETEAEPIIDQTMEETSRHQINSETNIRPFVSIDRSTSLNSLVITNVEKYREKKTN